MKNLLNRFSRLAPLLAAVLLLTLFAGCDKWWESDSPTAETPDVPFGLPEAEWDTGIGTMLVYPIDNRHWTAATEEEFQDALDALLFRIERVAGAEARAQVSLGGQNLVLQDSRKETLYVKAKATFWVGSGADFQVLALDFFCKDTGHQAICDLR